MGGGGGSQGFRGHRGLGFRASGVFCSLGGVRGLRFRGRGLGFRAWGFRVF